MNTTELIEYYANLLILQYLGAPRAYETIKAVVTPVVMPQTTIEEIAFSLAPDAGAFTVFYGVDESPSILWNDSASAVETKLQTIPGLSTVTVSGSIASKSLVVTFTGVTPLALILSQGANTLTSSSDPVTLTITETDVTLPIAVQDAFNVTGPNPAVGVQLDVIGKYAGVSRTGQGFTTQITLNDTDFKSYIQLAITQNSAGSSTAEIVGLLNQFFPGEVFLFDLQTMEFDYYLSTALGSDDLVQLFITQGKLPKPMGVRIRLIIYAPVINMFFGFRTYFAPAYNVTPFNSYADYQMNWPWLSYQNAIII